MLIETPLNDDSPLRNGPVIYVAPDCTDSAVRRRVRGFQSVGTHVVSFSFRRTRYNTGFVPDWPNVELGTTTEQRLGSRVFASLRALGVIVRHRKAWREASMVCARNLDLALLAWIAKTVTGSPALLVYEVLDIHPSTTAEGLRGKLLRWLERRVSRRCRLLVVSSPAFYHNYFLPVQGYQGNVFLLENKWPSAEVSNLPRQVDYELIDNVPRWTIGWFGNIRCPRSLEILAELADALPHQVRIYIRGCASLIGESALLKVIEDRRNMIFDGEYNAPADLPELYSKVHFNWCVDLCGGKNSRWLLPNRLYEGGFFGIPALAIDGHETGRVVRQRKLGVVLSDPIIESLREFLSNMSSEHAAFRGTGPEALVPVADERTEGAQQDD